MKRIVYSGITKTILAFTLIFCCCVAVHYVFLTLRAPLLYGTSDSVYETRQYSELFSKYVERTAVYVRYREDGYQLSTADIDSELALLLNGEVTDTDLESALFNVYEPNETAFYYYHAKLNEEPTNYQYYVENTKTGEVYTSAAFEQYAIEKSGNLDTFLASGILQENIYLILNTANNRSMTGGGNNDVLNRSNLLWSMDFLCRPLSEMAEDLHYDNNYHISNDSAHTNDKDHLESISSSEAAPAGSSKAKSEREIKIEESGIQVEVLPSEPSNGNYLLYAFVAENLVEDDFTALSQKITSAKDDFNSGLQTTVFYILFSVFLFVIGNVLSGKKGTEEGIHLHFYDRIFSELILAALLVWCLIPFFAWNVVSKQYWETSFTEFLTDYPKYSQWIPFFHGCLIFFLFVAGILYFSLIRRIKAKKFLSSSLLGRYVILPLGKLFRYIVSNVKEFFLFLPSLWKTIFYLGFGIIWLTVTIVLFLLEQLIPGLVALLLGALFCVLLCLRNMLDRARISQSTAQMSAGNLSVRIPTNSMLPSNKNLSENINQICDGLHSAVEEQTKSERMKTELITNVSHDIKTPLTSIINYIELIKNELPQEGAVAEYAEVLSQKSWRLKGLIDDLVEASKAASGTMQLDLIRFNAVELLRQAVGDFEERLTEQNLTLCMELPTTPVNVLADGACTHRIIENMLSNVCKYALSGTRVFISLDLPEDTGLALLTVKNTSASVLTKTPEELLIRFSRGNDDRSGEGSGLGLSIAESLAELQGGNFYVEIDGDLFKAKLTIPLAK